MSSGSEISYKPKLICLTGYAGTGKTTVKDMFTWYKDTVTLDNIDDIRKIPEKSKLVVFDSLTSIDELTYLRWTRKFDKVLVVNVDCTNNRRIQRLIDRDKCSELSIGLRDKKEKENINKILQLVDYNIHNSRSLEETNGQVYYLHSLLTKEQIAINQFTSSLENTR